MNKDQFTLLYLQQFLQNTNNQNNNVSISSNPEMRVDMSFCNPEFMTLENPTINVSDKMEIEVENRENKLDRQIPKITTKKCKKKNFEKNTDNGKIKEAINKIEKPQEETIFKNEINQKFKSSKKKKIDKNQIKKSVKKGNYFIVIYKFSFM